MRRLATVLAVPVAAITLGLGLVACESSSPAKPNPQKEGQRQTEQAYGQQSSAVPYPVSELRDSLERRNVRERLLRTNKADRLGFVYLMNFGKVIGYYAIKGKVSNTDSQMTTTDLVQYACDDGLTGCQALTVPAPGDDGSYGPNEPGVFFFTVEGAFVETSLEYLYADQPLPIDVPRLNSKSKG